MVETAGVVVTAADEKADMEGSGPRPDHSRTDLVSQSMANPGLLPIQPQRSERGRGVRIKSPVIAFDAEQATKRW